jgi:hypothetical protein
MMKSKRSLLIEAQLGMSWSTARSKLLGSLLFKLAVDAGHACFRCGLPLTADTISMEHKVPWLHAANSAELFFDLSNVVFSHGSCNSKASRKPIKKWGSDAERDRMSKRRRWASLSVEQRKAIRRKKYLEHGI